MKRLADVLSASPFILIGVYLGAGPGHGRFRLVVSAVLWIAAVAALALIGSLVSAGSRDE